MRFEWDPRKAKLNLAKHDVAFAEAATVFDDPLSATFEDADHSLDERRMITLGYSRKGRLLVVSHTDAKEAVRIISARQATSLERRRHEENSR